MSKPMTAFSANPAVFIFSGLILVAALAYFAYGALDYLGVAEESKQAVVTGKQYNPPRVTYRNNIVAGRNYTQADTMPETYVLTLTIDGEPTAAIVSKQLYDTVQAQDKVSVRAKRMRLSGRLEVTEVTQ